MVDVQHSRAAPIIAELFAGWYLAPEAGTSAAPPVPAMVVREGIRPPRIPAGMDEFEIAGGGRCCTDGRMAYIDIDGATIAIGAAGLAAVEIWIPPPPAPALQVPALTRIVSYALAAALRRHRLFELHSAALVDPDSGRGLLIIGPSGSGKSTLTVHLAAAGWSFLTDDVLLLSRESVRVQAWPLRRCFAVTSDTFAASRFLQTRLSFDGVITLSHDKCRFLPDAVFAAEFQACCVPLTLFFSELSGGSRSSVSRLAPGETMARLIRMSPWSCYDRSTAGEHLATLSALARQSAGYSLIAGRDLLDPQRSVTLLAGCARG
jgi:hypothetical protein